MHLFLQYLHQIRLDQNLEMRFGIAGCLCFLVWRYGWWRFEGGVVRSLHWELVGERVWGMLVLVGVCHVRHKRHIDCVNLGYWRGRVEVFFCSTRIKIWIILVSYFIWFVCQHCVFVQLIIKIVDLICQIFLVFTIKLYLCFCQISLVIFSVFKFTGFVKLILFFSVKPLIN